METTTPQHPLPLILNSEVNEIDELYPLAVQPSNGKIQLKRHQLSLLRRCIDFENMKLPIKDSAGVTKSFMKTSVGIIGDKVGSGKSFVILSIILGCDQQSEDTTSIRSYGMNKVILFDVDTPRPSKTNILVIPHNLCAQWSEYIRTFCPDIKYAVVNKTKSLSELLDVGTNIESYDLILVTATYYNRLCEFTNYKGMKMRRVIFDEVDHLNIPSCENMDATFYWFVTASYGNLVYPRGNSRYDRTVQRYVVTAEGIRNAGFIKDLFINLMSANGTYTKLLIAKNSDEYIKSSVELPEIVDHFVKCKTPVSINILNGIVDRTVIESLNAGDVETALQYINPSQRRSEDNIVTILIEKYEKQIHNTELTLQYTERLVYDRPEDRQVEIARLTKKKKELENHIENIKRRIRESEMCCICYDDIEKKTILSCCSNAYCFKCINIWLSKHAICPLCKHVQGKNTMFVVSDEEANALDGCVDMIEDTSGLIHENNEKLRNLRNILVQRGDQAKILIFSAHENTFTQISHVLQDLNIQYAYLKGNSFQIKHTVENYKTGSIRVLLVNTYHYGSGLNLENTSDIIMFHKFNTESEKQVIGRAQRYGRTVPLKVWYLLHANEMTALSTAE